jgi:hypothetical protein
MQQLELVGLDGERAARTGDGGGHGVFEMIDRQFHARPS